MFPAVELTPLPLAAASTQVLVEPPLQALYCHDQLIGSETVPSMPVLPVKSVPDGKKDWYQLLVGGPDACPGPPNAVAGTFAELGEPPVAEKVKPLVPLKAPCTTLAMVPVPSGAPFGIVRKVPASSAMLPS
jgi:hypothetical protein